MSRKYHSENKQAWNQAAVSYQRRRARTTDLIRSGGNSMCKVELPYLANLKDWCERAIHLQCAGGEDTLSLLNLGAKEVVGIDISDEMIAVAEQTSTELGANAKWICSDILDTPQDLNNSADLIYTGRGAINWIHDLRAWAQTIFRLLRPGGKLYIFEGHPVTYMFDMNSPRLSLDPDFVGYFSTKVYKSEGWPKSYIESLNINESEVASKYERAWNLSAIINVLIDAGLKLQRFEEHPNAYWEEFPNMSESERSRIPNTYSLLMLKP